MIDEKYILESVKERDLKSWADENLKKVIIGTTDEQDLHNQYTEYLGMPLDQRRQADWKSLELTGKTNTERYNEYLGRLSRRDLPSNDESEYDGTDPIEHIDEAVESKYDFTQLKYTDTEVNAAIDYSNEALRAIIVPTNSLDKLEDNWIKYKSMIRKHQRESDWKSIELFGIDNETHYNYLKSRFVKKDMEEEIEDLDNSAEDNTTSVITTSESHIEKKCRFIRSLDQISDVEYISESTMVLSKEPKSFCEEMLLRSTIDNTIEIFKGNVAQVNFDYIPNIDMPFYDPEEMEDLGIFSKNTNLFSVEPDNTMLDGDVTTEDWYNEFVLNFNGFSSENSEQLWRKRNQKLRELCSDFGFIKEHGTEEHILSRKQSILELGWNPDLEFTPANRDAANKRMSNILQSKHGVAEVVNLTEFVDSQSTMVDTGTSVAVKEKIDNSLYPIYIVLIEGTSVFSKVVKDFTHGVYSHAAIGFDASLDKLYSYNIAGSTYKGKGGLSIESIKSYPQDNNLGVYTIFVQKKDLDAIHKMVDTFVANMDKTRYGFSNLLTLIFNVPFNRDWNLICSQFVDRLLKVADIDITKKDSSLVNPNDFAFASSKNKKIYKLYKGKTKRYNSKKVSALIDKLSANAQYIKECVFMNNPLFESVFGDYTIKAVVNEAKEFPVQFDNDGNLLIRNIKKINFDKEFADSHKLLMEYSKHDNTDGMKYELAKLWFLNSLLEKNIHGTRHTLEEKKKFTSTRALILNDFKKYMDETQKLDSSFNFIEYYNSTPFSDTVIKVNKTTLSATIALLKSIL